MANNGWNYNGGYPPQYPPQQPRRNNNRRNNQQYWGQPQYPPQQRNDYRQPQYPPQDEGPQYPFDIGQMVRHRYSGTELCVIRFGNEQIECRLPDLRSDWFYPHELEPIDESAKEK